MSESSFYEEYAKSEARQAVAEIEAQTSAEVVVALRRASAGYRDADYLAGFVLAVIALLVMLFADFTFALGTFPAGVIGSFIAGALVTSQIAPIRRLLTLPSRRRAEVRSAARAAFVDLGVSRTSGRTGILVFVSLFEREVEVVADIGVDPALLGEAWPRALEDLRAVLKPRPVFARFAEKLRALGPALATALPRAQDDVNELSDEVAAQ